MALQKLRRTKMARRSGLYLKHSPARRAIFMFPTTAGATVAARSRWLTQAYWSAVNTASATSRISSADASPLTATVPKRLVDP